MFFCNKFVIMVFGSAHALCASRMLTHSSSSYSKRKNDNSSTTDAERPRKKIKKTNYFDKDIICLSKYHDKVYFHSLLNSDDISSHQESYRIISNKESSVPLNTGFPLIFSISALVTG